MRLRIFPNTEKKMNECDGKQRRIESLRKALELQIAESERNAETIYDTTWSRVFPIRPCRCIILIAVEPIYRVMDSRRDSEDGCGELGLRFCRGLKRVRPLNLVKIIADGFSRDLLSWLLLVLAEIWGNTLKRQEVL